MKRALLCLVFLASASEASALELSFDEEARDLVAVGVPEAPAAPPQAEGVGAPDEEAAAEAPVVAPRELWRYPNVYRSGQTVPQPVVTRVGGDDVAVYCVNSYLYEANARTGVVGFRRLLPGTCLGLALEGTSKVTVTLDPRYRTFYSERTKPPAETSSFEYTIGEHVRGDDVFPRVETDSYVAFAQASNWLKFMAAEGAPEDDESLEYIGDEHREWLERRLTFGEAPDSTLSFEDFERVIAWRSEAPEGKAWSARVLAMMVQGRERDPTNLWFPFYEGMVHWEQGRKDLALASWQRLIQVPHDLAHETIRMLPMLARVGAPGALVGGLREHILTSLLRGGYEPELSRSLIWLACHWKTPGPKLDLSNPEHLAIADSYAEDWFALTWGMESTRAALEAMTRAHREADNDARAGVLERRVDAHPGGMMGARQEDVEWAMYALPIPGALTIAVALLCLIGLLRRLGARWVPVEGEGKAPWWLQFNLLSTTHRGALAGMIALIVAATYVVWRILLNVAVLGVAASGPTNLDSNQLGSDEVGAYLEEFETTPDILFYRGLHHQHADRTDRAKALYEESGTARAWNNIGVLAHRAGDAEAAQRAWAKALEFEPGLEAAAYNTRGEVTGERSARLKEYAPERKLFALPTMRTRVDMNHTKARAILVTELIGQGDPDHNRTRDSIDVTEVMQSLMVLLLLIAPTLFGMLAPRRGYTIEARSTSGETSERALAGVGLLGWIGGLLTPGGAHALGALRPWLLGATLASAALYFATKMAGGETSSIIRSISNPSSYGRVLGVHVSASDSADALDLALMSFGEAWWALALGCLLVGFVAEYLRPDPVGLLARMRAGRGDAEE